MQREPIPNAHDRAPVIETDGVVVEIDGREVLAGVDLAVRPGERWIVLGANGSGKTTLLRVLALRHHPTRGTVRVNGLALGAFDVRAVRPRLALVSASLGAELRGAMSALDAVMSAAHGALETWWHTYDDADAARAAMCLERTGVGRFASRPIASLSSGELQRVLLARALMVDPVAILFDEPSARLDLRGREDVVAMLDDASAADQSLPTVLVTHHVDEIPRSATHCLLLRHGRTVAAGTIDDVLTSDRVSECFDVRVDVERRMTGRWSLHPR
jgi:iron complex transport system ATP-binding protein